MSSKKIICADALEYLAGNECAAIITSPPDADEIGLDIEAWEAWFATALDMCFLASTGPLVFYVTDRMDAGIWRSKSHLVMSAATRSRVKQAWHKIVLRRDPMQTDLHRPTFTHMMAFNGKPKKRTPDVIPRGGVLYPNGMGLVPARMAVEWVRGQAESVVDPFCGQGTIPAVAEAMGLDCIGIDILEDQCAKSRKLKLRLK